MIHHSIEASKVTTEASSHLIALIRIARVHPEPDHRIRAAWALGGLAGLKLPGMENELQALAQDSDPTVREAALTVVDLLTMRRPA